MKTKILALAALVLSLAACTQDELADNNRLPEGEYPVLIRATGLSVEATPQAAPSTRATVDGDWQGVTSVALKLGDAVKEYTVTASTDFKSATLSRENDPHYWTSRDPITVSAWWPFDNADITQMPAVKVAEDQSQLADCDVLSLVFCHIDICWCMAAKIMLFFGLTTVWKKKEGFRCFLHWLPDFVQDCWRFIFWLFLPYVRESTGKRISRL